MVRDCVPKNNKGPLRCRRRRCLGSRLGNAGRPPLTPRRNYYYRSIGRTRLCALHTRIFITRHEAPPSLSLVREATMTNKIDLGGRNAVVTGGAQGIGRAIVERFVDLGATVAVWVRDITLAKKRDRKRTRLNSSH